MSGLSILIPIALLLGLAGLAGFFWAMRSGQFEDLDGAALRILIEDVPAPGDAEKDHSFQSGMQSTDSFVPSVVEGRA